MTRGAKLMLAGWTFMSLGCSAGMEYESAGPEGEGGSVTIGATAGGGARQAQELDRSTPPRVAPPPSLDFPEVQDETLDNGLRVILVERHGLPLVSLEFLFAGGASAHPTSQAGLASLTAEMLDEGTESRTAIEIGDAIDLLGASMYTAAGYDGSRVGLSVLRNRLQPALDIVADIVMRPAFPEAELDRVKRERTARILQRSDMPGALADDAFYKVLFGEDHPYGAPLIGTAASLEGLDRDALVRFHRERYAPGQATLVVVGDITGDDLEGLLDGAFAGWSGEGSTVAAPAAPAATPTPGIYVVDKPGAAQSEVRVGRVALDRTTEAYYPAMVANTVLGGSFTSRLNSNLREDKGYTYGARSFFDMRRSVGPFEASAAVATPVTDASVVEFVRELQTMGDEDVPADELDRAKNYLALRLPQRFEANSDVVGRLSELVQYGIPLTFWEGYVDGVMDVDAAAVRRLAAEELNMENMVIVIAGDRATIEEPLKALGLGEVVILNPGPVSE